MRSMSVAQAKAHLSALLDAVEAGEDVEITRRGTPVARLTAPERIAGKPFDLAAFLGATTSQPIHQGPSADVLITTLRHEARF
jgi:prevent-host-death family protein